ncbi:uncharacterized protein SPPG_06336 [Spizellomyces punctatus DAOM BR117]|uniref:Uncharacterized protein n=1 Tax=Spizellomyces punctatus (strain DAOM BR117) TaxID=645134 RepID=A0A0L0HCN6_SPIPD|nr:uncharacterized protein SPPG_06336 [Spizellomyces punctatus DAOM BR117]KNC98654.1 hypothetical protein SPPG_06336 [Spizellomyces punctatus DAOM BR117]|eukprot:XP_016606694.1 hypothetical protein SPPG_06336 [Spizellomyces punctatus DAOM BR117]
MSFLRTMRFLLESRLGDFIPIRRSISDEGVKNRKGDNRVGPRAPQETESGNVGNAATTAADDGPRSPPPAATRSPDQAPANEPPAQTSRSPPPQSNSPASPSQPTSEPRPSAPLPTSTAIVPKPTSTVQPESPRPETSQRPSASPSATQPPSPPEPSSRPSSAPIPQPRPQPFVSTAAAPEPVPPSPSPDPQPRPQPAVSTAQAPRPVPPSPSPDPQPPPAPAPAISPAPPPPVTSIRVITSFIALPNERTSNVVITSTIINRVPATTGASTTFVTAIDPPSGADPTARPSNNPSASGAFQSRSNNSNPALIIGISLASIIFIITVVLVVSAVAREVRRRRARRRGMNLDTDAEGGWTGNLPWVGSQRRRDSARPVLARSTGPTFVQEHDQIHVEPMQRRSSDGGLSDYHGVLVPGFTGTISSRPSSFHHREPIPANWRHFELWPHSWASSDHSEGLRHDVLHVGKRDGSEMRLVLKEDGDATL